MREQRADPMFRGSVWLSEYLYNIFSLVLVENFCVYLGTDILPLLLNMASIYGLLESYYFPFWLLAV